MDNPSALVVPSEITRISPFPSGVTLLPSQLGAGGSSPTPAFTNTYSVDFDGTNDYIAIDGVATSYASDTTGTISAWIKMDDATPAAASYIFSISDASGSTFTSLYVNPEGRLTFAVQKTGTNQVIVRTDPTAFSDNTWYHVAVVQDGVLPVVYIDGSAPTQSTLVSTDTTAYLGDLTGLDVATIGALRYQNSTSLYYAGLIEEVSYFSNITLTGGQLSSIYNSGIPASLTSYSPSGWWRMGDNNGGTGTTVTDQGSGGNNGTLVNGPTFSTDVPVFTNTYSVDFDSTNDYITIANTLATTFQASFSIVAWVKMDGTGGTRAILSMDNASFYDRVSLFQNGSGQIAMFYAADNTQTSTLTDTVSGVDLTAWTNIIAVFKQNGGNIDQEIFINGTSQVTNSTAVTMSNYGNTNTPVAPYIGARNNNGGSPSLYWNGKIDELAIIPSAINSTQATAIYNSGDPIDLTTYSPVLWHRMGDNDGGTGTTITDQGSGGNNGTLTNGPTFSSDVAGAPLAELTNTYSVDFDGTNDYMSADGAASAASGFTGGTWMAWVAPDDATPNIGNTIISFGDDDANSYLSIEIGGISQTDISATCLNAGTQQWTIKKTNIGWSDTDWHHVAIVHNGTDAIIYVDGVSIGATYTLSTDKTVWHSGIAGLDKFTVGAQIKNGGESLRFNGKIDEVAICETQLTAANLLEIASATTAKAADLSSYSPVGWWRMGDNDGGTGTTVTDQGSGSNNGTLTNGPTFSTTVQ